MLDKTSLRRELRVERSFFARARPPLLPLHGYLKQLNPTGCVAAYLCLAGEANPTNLVRSAQAIGCSIALPHVVSRTEPISFHLYQPDDPLCDGPFGLRQPRLLAPLAVPTIILTPLLGFTRSGARLGQGAGHYDRAFAMWPNAMRIGVAWSVQERVALPEDPWDIRLHAVLTEREWIVTS